MHSIASISSFLLVDNDMGVCIKEKKKKKDCCENDSRTVYLSLVCIEQQRNFRHFGHPCTLMPQYFVKFRNDVQQNVSQKHPIGWQLSNMLLIFFFFFQYPSHILECMKFLLHP